jgi:nucleolar protein 15
MPKHITLSRRKQSEPADLDTFKEKRAEREKKKRKAQAEQAKAKEAQAKFADDDDDDVDKDVVHVALPVPKRKQPLAIAATTKKPKKKTADEAVDDDAIEGFDGQDDDDDDDGDDDDDDNGGDGDDDSSSLSVGDMRNDFEALQSSIEQGLSAANKQPKKAKQSSGSSAAAAAAAAASDDDVHPDLKPAVLYVGHIPFGFHERQLEAFFGQFGEVLRVKLARSKRTGGSRHFAFVEFRRLHVAKVVVEAMNGYIMYRRRLVCAIVPPEKCHDRMWSISRTIVKSRGERRALSQLQHGAAVADAATAEAAETKRAARNEARKQKLASLGIDVDALQKRKTGSK